MTIEEKKTEASVRKAKEQFEVPAVKIIMFENSDIITASDDGFHGGDDPT